MGKVKLYATLRQRAGRRDIEVPWAAGASLGDVLKQLVTLEPVLEGQILDECGELVPYVSVFLDGRDARYLGGLHSGLEAQTEIAIFPPVAGGA